MAQFVSTQTFTHTTPSGQRLHATIAGTGQPLLCLHGHPGSGTCFDPVLASLRDRYRTIAPDLRGYGQSGTREPFAMEAHVGDLVSLLDRLDISVCTIIGWSLGGILAIELALRDPDRVQGLVLLGTAARPYSDHPAVSTGELALTAIAGLTSSIWPAAPFLPAIGRRSLFRHLIAQHTIATYRNIGRYGVSAYLQTSRAATAALNAAIRQRYDREADLDAIACPSLVIAATHDRHICAAASQRTAARLPHSEWICYDNAAHLFPWEWPDRLRDDLENWLTQQHLAET